MVFGVGKVSARSTEYLKSLWMDINEICDRCVLVFGRLGSYKSTHFFFSFFFFPFNFSGDHRIRTYSVPAF